MRREQRVMVYGTLRRHGSNHGYLRGARYLGQWLTEPVFSLLDVGSWPGVVAGGNTSIVTEVYRITPAVLARLDRLEDCPLRYRRIVLPTPWGGAWLYVYRPPFRGHRQIVSGDWMAHDHRRRTTRPPRPAGR